VKRLLDQNLPRRLVADLANALPKSAHVRDFASEQATDREIYDFAARRDFCIVTKDVGFRDLVAVNAAPPKLVLVRFANVSSEVRRRRLLARLDQIDRFLSSPNTTLQLLSQP
jgi:predicted nuclease of predicted toxin-antitoxin system